MDVHYRASDNKNSTPVSNATPMPVTFSGSSGYPSGAVPLAVSSGNKANASAVAALAATSGVKNYVSGFQLTGSGATTGLPVTATLSDGTFTLDYTFTFPAGALVSAVPLTVTFTPPIPASAVNTAITLTLPAGGTGNTNAAASIQGYQV